MQIPNLGRFGIKPSPPRLPLLEFIAVGEVVLIEGSYSSLYILVIYMCVTEPSRNRRQESSGTFGSNIPSFENKDVDVDVNVQLL